jgi:hypothetical protein
MRELVSLARHVQVDMNTSPFWASNSSSPPRRNATTMRLLGSLLSLLAISPIAFVAGEDKLAKSSQLSTKSKSGVIELTNDLYNDITTTPRNYTAIVMFTALDSKFGCMLCKEVQPEYELLAKAGGDSTRPEMDCCLAC